MKLAVVFLFLCALFVLTLQARTKSKWSGRKPKYSQRASKWLGPKMRGTKVPGRLNGGTNGNFRATWRSALTKKPAGSKAYCRKNYIVTLFVK